MALTAPAPLADHHELGAFRCAEEDLATWLIQRARKNQQEGASRTFVACHGNAVVGYYCLSAGSVTRADAPGSIRRNMPDPIPVAIMGRLAVHADRARQGIGRGLLKDAVLRTIGVSQEIGIRALLCHAISVDAKAFYLKYGFVESPVHPMTLLLPLS